MVIGGSTHGAISHIESHETESRINHGALAPPFGSVGDKHAFANEWIQGANHQIAFWEYTLCIAHYLLHGGRTIEQDSTAT